MEHRGGAALADGLDEIRCSPTDEGVVERIVRRPAESEREALTEATLDDVVGLVGDIWPVRHSRRTPEQPPHPDRQLTVMNARVAALVAGRDDRWELAGDQLYVDFDLSEASIPAGTRLAVGSAVIVVTDQPHLGCRKFADRFGQDALRFVNSPVGRELRLRGVNTRIVVSGSIRVGAVIRKVAPSSGAG